MLKLSSALSTSLAELDFTFAAASYHFSTRLNFRNLASALALPITVFSFSCSKVFVLVILCHQSRRASS